MKPPAVDGPFDRFEHVNPDRWVSCVYGGVVLRRMPIERVTHACAIVWHAFGYVCGKVFLAGSRSGVVVDADRVVLCW